MTITDRIHFRMMSLIHEDLYGLLRDPYKALSAAGLEPGQEVLEVGCGPGFFTIPAARIVGDEGRVVTLDISRLAIQRVRQKIEQAGVTNVETILGDAARTGLPDESFDLIFLFGFRGSVGDMEDILAEQDRLLKPRGILSTEGQLWNSSELFRPVKREGRILRFTKIG